MKKSSKTVFQTPFFEIEELAWDSRHSLHPYYRLNAADSAICCLINRKGNFLMVKQYRPTMEAHTVEFPAGEIGQGEPPLEAARREVAEEIGVDSILLSLGNYSLMMNRTNIRNYLFLGLASGLPVQKKQEEGIKRLEVTKEKFKKMVMKGEYLQLAGLGLLQIVRLKYGVDLLRDPLKKILSIFE